ncbi:MAG TPA: toxin TcdB middle/N-terminal domain-containing protein, partial [Clostridia bacterium]|nr:toxin TcdB middle/N-terminal domain-containing protein [Clostridia bacterium]
MITATLHQGLWRVMLIFCCAFAVAAADKSGVTPNTVSLPKGPGAIEGLGESFQPALNTGTASYGLTIKVPPGTRGFAPALRLQYEGGGGNGPLGFGWQLSIPCIQRRSDNGIPTYGQHMGFPRQDAFMNDAREDLVPLTNGFWFCKNEAAFIRYRPVGNHWEGVRPDGTLLEFGLSSAGRIEGPGPNQVYAWLLERERDTCGNTILYQYSEFPGANNQRQKYLRSVSYGPGQPPWNNFHFLTFLYEDRADWFEDCRPGFILRTGKRLKEIIVATQGPTLTNHLAGDFNADGQADFLNRKYILEYADYAGTNSHWSLLAGVTLFGADGLTALPPARFGYTISNPPDNLALANQFIGGLNEPPLVMDSPQVDFLDLNADGLPDILRTDPGGSTHWGWLNRGEVNNAIQWQAPVELNSEDGRALLFNLQSTTPTAHLADMDGDGVADLAVTALDGSVFYFKNHSSLAWGPRRDMSTQDVAPPSPFGNTAVRTADLDFDKRIDIIQSISTGNGTDYRIWFNLADQSYSPGIIVPQNNGLSFASPGIHLADMNGDRIPDLVAIFPSLNKVSSGLGYGRFADPIDVQIPDTLLDESMIAKMSLTDLNGDGLSDLVLERAAPGQLWYWINLGNFTLSRRKTITGMPTAIGASAVIRWADLNGNGTTDIVYADSSSEPRLQAVDIGMHLNSGPQPNLLIAISNGIGRVSQIGYASSTAFAIADALGGKPWPDPMPNPVTVVSSITNLDSLGHNYVTLWRYHNGYYDPEEKQFRGFAEAEQIEVGDPSAPTLVTRSRFDTGRVHEALKGKLLGLSLEQDDGSVFSTETNFWTSPPVTLYTGTNGTNVVFAHPTGSVKLIAELGQGIPRRLETALGFDLFGNQTTNAAYGIVEGGSRAAFNDERITRTEFAVNEDDWLIRLPKLEETTTSDGEVISRIQYFYDDESFSGNNTEIQKGNRTLTRAWIAPANPEAFITLERCRYDSFGNRTLILDPLGSLLNGAPNLAAGHAREIEYDARFHTHPVRETVHVGNGKPTLAFSVDYDQGFATPTTSTDFNNHLTLYR